MFCKTYTVQSDLPLSPCSCWGFGGLFLKLENWRNRRVRQKVLTFLVCEQTLYFWWKKGATRECKTANYSISFPTLFCPAQAWPLATFPDGELARWLAGYNILSSYTNRVFLHTFYMKSSAQCLPFFWINLPGFKNNPIRVLEQDL